jgi:hypothetical protein
VNPNQHPYAEGAKDSQKTQKGQMKILDLNFPRPLRHFCGLCVRKSDPVSGATI